MGERERIYQAAQDLASRATSLTIGSVIGEIVTGMCLDISKRIKIHKAPLRRGFLKKLPFKIKRDRLLYELTHLCIYSGHFALQIASKPAFYKRNIDLYYKTICIDSRLKGILYTDNGRDHERRCSKYADIVEKTMKEDQNEHLVGQRVRFIFELFYYADGKGIGLPNGGPFEDIFITGLIQEIFVMPFSLFTYSITLLK